MASKFLSPGVFTEEIDQSFLAQGVAGIGAAVVGGAEDGPAFFPITVANYTDWVERFGSLNPLYQGSYAAKNYLRNKSPLKYVRVLGHTNGGTATAGYSVGGITGISDVSGSAAKVLAVIHHSGTTSVTSVNGVATDADNFIFTIGSFSVTASFVTSSANYIEKVLNTDPTRYTTDNHYLYQVFKYAKAATSASWHRVAVSGTLTSFAKAYTSGSTPWIKSQDVGGTEYNMFKFHTLAHGRVTNDSVKVSVQNIKTSANPGSNPWGTFDVVVRKFYDSDIRPQVIESFVGLTMDPDDRNYILRRIGDRYEEYDTVEQKFVIYGDYAAKSKRIRVELNKNNGAPAEALPWGHRGYDRLKYVVGAFTGSGQTVGVANAIPSLTYQPNQLDTNSNYNRNIYWGVQFVSGGVVDRMRAPTVFAGTEYADNVAQDTDFTLRHLSGNYTAGSLRYEYNTAVSTHTPVFLSASMYKFTLPFHGGFDGFDLRTENPLDITNTADDTNLGVSSLKRGIDTIADPDYIDINLLAVPGVHNLKVTDHARITVGNRSDAMYVMDITGSTVSEVVDSLKNRELDDNYTAAYYPDVKVDDKENNRIVRLMPSAVVLGAYAYSDRTSQEWFAPAGMNRGGLTQFDVVDVVDRLKHSDRDSLYDNRINPIASFPNEGQVIFGQKTLQASESALDRVNVRRLLIFAKKTIAAAAKFLVFEPNNTTTYTRFMNTVNPILDRVRQDQGIERFAVVMDTNINTPDVVDRNIMKGKIFIQPIKSAEFIDLSFVITNAGVQFGA